MFELLRAILPRRAQNYISSKLKDAHYAELLKGSSNALALKMIGMGAGYVFVLLITRNFGASQMGVFALSMTLLSVASVPAMLGIDTALVRFAAEYNAEGRDDLVRGVYVKALKIVTPVSFLIALTVFIFSPFLAKAVFHKENLSFYFRLISVAILPYALLSTNSQLLRGLKKIREFSFLYNISYPLFACIFLLGFLAFLKDGSAPVASYASGLVLAAALSFVFVLKKKGFRGFSHDNGTRTDSHGNEVRLKTLLKVSLPMLLTSSMFLVMHWTDMIMLGMFRTESEVGVYSVVLKMATLAGIPLFAINSIAAPKFAEFYRQRDMEGLGRFVRQSTKIVFWTSFPFLLAYALFPSPILGVFGDGFSAGAFALLFLAAGQFTCAISGSVGHLLNMTGRQNILQNIMFGATGINILLNALLIPDFGINGAAFASLISMAFLNLASVAYVKRHFNIVSIYFPFLRGAVNGRGGE
jgi:O-antigen/teichoic acid export membrane protein